MKNYLEVIKTFLGWRFILFFLSLPVIGLAGNLTPFANFDGLRYISIAQEGYGTPNTFYSYSLFPLYPLLIKFLSPLFGYLYSGLFLSHLFLLLSLIAFYRLARLDYSKSVAQKAIMLLLCFPASFFFVSVYSESLFLFLSLTSVYFCRQKKYLFSVLVAALASYTRAAGIFLWLIILVEYLEENKGQIKEIFKPKLLLLLIPPLGFVYYLNYLQIYTSSILKFLPSIPNKFVFLHQVILRYLKMIIFIDHTSSLFWVILTELIIGFFMLYLLVVSYNKIRFSYWLYFFISYLIPTLWGSYSGISRFIVVVFPMFYFLSFWLETKPQIYQKAFYLFSFLLMILNMSLFLKGVFVG